LKEQFNPRVVLSDVGNQHEETKTVGEQVFRHAHLA